MLRPVMAAAFFRTSGGDVAFTDETTDSGRTLEISGEVVSSTGQAADFTMTSSGTADQLSLTGLMTAAGQDPAGFNFATIKTVTPRPAIRFPANRQIA